jgi:glyoxylase I family protein
MIAAPDRVVPLQQYYREPTLSPRTIVEDTVRCGSGVEMPTLNIEHVACNVSDPPAMAAWYVEHLGMRIVRRNTAAPHIHFLADANERVAIEIYSNSADAIPDYQAMHPLRFHIAFDAPDPDAARVALVAAGATFVNEQTLPDGSRLLMLRDPWGLPLQLCKRATALLPAS